MLPLRFKLCAKRSDMDVDRTTFVAVLVAPEYIEEGIPGDNFVRGLHQLVKNSELGVGQCHFIPCHLTGPSLEIHCDLINADPGRFLVPAELSIDAGDEFQNIERLLEIVIRPKVESVDFVHDLALGGNDHDFDVVIVLVSAKLSEDVEAITQGANIVDGTSPSAYCDYGCYDMMALDLMRMIKSPEECDILNDSELFKEMCDQIEAASGIKVIAINWPNQPRCILSAKPINSVADINGLIIRVPSAPYVAFFTRLGAAPVSMSMADTYTAMQQGSADACEFPLTTIYTNSLYEVGKYCYLSEHTYAPSMWCMNANIFNSLSEADQQVILEEFEAGGKEFAALNESNLAEYRQMLEAQGVAFVEPSAEDIAIMDQAAVDSAADFPGLSDGIIEKVEAALGR